MIVSRLTFLRINKKHFKNIKDIEIFYSLIILQIFFVMSEYILYFLMSKTINTGKAKKYESRSDLL